MSELPESATTIPAPPRVPTDLIPDPEFDGAASDSPAVLERRIDAEAARTDMVLAALSASTTATAKASEALGVLASDLRALKQSGEKRDEALSKMLAARFEDVDDQLKAVKNQLSKARGLTGALNQLVTGLRGFSNSLHDRQEKFEGKLRDLEARRISFRKRPARRRFLRVVANEG